MIKQYQELLSLHFYPFLRFLKEVHHEKLKLNDFLTEINKEIWFPKYFFQQESIISIEDRKIDKNLECRDFHTEIVTYG